MNFDVTRSQMQLLAEASPEDQRRVIQSMTPMDALRFDADFESWAHEGQRQPAGEGWRVWLMMAGRGFGKTRAGAEWIYRLGSKRRGLRIALVGATIADARSIMVEGSSGLLKVAALQGGRLAWEPGLGRLRWPNGSEAQLFSGEQGDGLRGPEHDFAWADELAKWHAPEATWDNLQLGLRRGRRARVLVTTTPRPMPLLERIRDEEWTVTTSGRTSDNINLDEKFIRIMTATYDGTRKGDQELDGKLYEQVEGALWPKELIARRRCDAPEWLDRIVVGVDPPAAESENGAACGIVVAGRCGERLYVLEDASVQGLSPEGWSNRVAAAAARWGASLVVAEANNGGAMVNSVLLAADSQLRVKLVHASQGKAARAEPVALRFEAGRAFLSGCFPELEAEMAGFSAGRGYQGRSPDRADAMVWALTELGETRSGVPRVTRL